MKDYTINYRYNNMDCSLTVAAANRVMAILNFDDMIADMGIDVTEIEFISMEVR